MEVINNSEYKVLLSLVFDDLSGSPSTVELRRNVKNPSCDHIVVISHDGNGNAKEVELANALRDQWGVWLSVAGYGVGQEDGTRSFLHAFIKCLERMRSEGEFETKDATTVIDITECFDQNWYWVEKEDINGKITVPAVYEAETKHFHSHLFKGVPENELTVLKPCVMEEV
jgi:hypothetical protein